MSSFILSEVLPYIIGIVPGIILMVLVYKHDKVEREPIGLIIKLMIAGVVFGFPYVETLASEYLDSLHLTNKWLYAFIVGFLIAGLFEEALKYFVFDLAIWKSEEFDHTFDAIVYSVAFFRQDLPCLKLQCIFLGKNQRI